jgi:uncharacterized membrane protein YkvA (DUF1232 family)
MNEKLIVITEDDLQAVITIDEEDIQRAADDFVEWNRDLISVAPNALDLSPSKKQRFYEKIRRDILAWAKGKGINSKYLEYILLAPDLFILLVRLVADGRVPTKLRTILVAAIAYFIVPVDAMPEALLGPAGFIDDVVFAALGILTVLKLTDEAIVRQHWSGEGDVVELVSKVADAGEVLLGSRLWNAFKKKAALE